MMRRRFSFAAWDAARCAVVRRAFDEVPFYREQWAEARRALKDPVPTPARDLHDQLFRSAPLAAPFDVSREPSPWSGDPQTLRDVLRLAGVLHGVAVIEVRHAIAAWTKLGRLAYAPLLTADAPVADDAARAAANERAVALAARARVIVVAAPSEADAACAVLA